MEKGSGGDDDILKDWMGMDLLIMTNQSSQNILNPNLKGKLGRTFPIRNLYSRPKYVLREFLIKIK